MADNARSVSGKIAVIDNSSERVAYDLMVRIANAEASPSQDTARDYYLKLYIQCYAAAKGYDEANILKRR